MKTIHPSVVNGRLEIQASKSVLHRLLICAALAEGVSRIENIMLSDDISATLYALCAMGLCEYELQDNECIVTGGLHKRSAEEIHCGESGSTLRFLLPLAFDGQKRVFTGGGRLMKRPMQPYETVFKEAGYSVTARGIEVCGGLLPGDYHMPGNISSQFITGLLFVLPLLPSASHIIIDGELESAPYVALTRQAQAMFGIRSTVTETGFFVPGGQAYKPGNVFADGDYSHAAFFAVAAALSGRATLAGLREDSMQGDAQILQILRLVGARVEWLNGEVTVQKAGLKPIELDVSNIPDLVPALSVLACGTEGKSKLINAGRLRYKESDRLHAMAAELEKLGADIVEYEDSLVINGRGGAYAWGPQGRDGACRRRVYRERGYRFG